jgi:hypothetical protein
MSEKIFPLPEVGEVFNSNFICYKIDAEKGEGIGIAKEYEVKAYPTYLFLHPDGSLIMKSIGSMSSEEFLSVATTVLNELSSPKPFSDWEAEYLQNKSDTAFLRLYMEKRALLGKPNAEIFDEYLALLPEDKRVSKEIYDIYQRESPDIKINSLAYRNLCDNSAKFSKLYLTVDIFMQNAIENSLNEAIANKDTLLLEEIVVENEKRHKLLRLRNKEELYMKYYQRTNDFERYIHYATKHCESLMLISIDFKSATILRDLYSGQLNDISWNFFEKTSDKEALNNALRWSKRSLEMYPDNYMYMDTYANLLYKLGKKNQAISVQTKALKLVKKAGDDVAIPEYEETLQKMKRGELQ